jgi:hypothetical protein
VQRDDDGLRELVDERQDVLAVASAEDPVLVLEEDDLDVEPTEDPGGADVIATDSLRDRRHEARPLWARGLINDNDLLDPVDSVDAEQRRVDVCGEGTDTAGARWIG